MSHAPTSHNQPENLPLPHLDIFIASQTLRLTKRGELLFEAAISSAKNGIGFVESSYQTPTGKFRIREKIGEGAPLYTAFHGRCPTGIWSPDSRTHDGILTRVLWLDGLEAQNENTYRRYIYIHGTHAEELIGQPASLGCIRLKNTDMRQLFDLTPLHSTVIIHES